MVAKILCVAEKPSIARAVAAHLGGRYETRNVRGINWVKNYEFEFAFSPPWGTCRVVMTCVAGHIASTDFDSRYRQWSGCNPIDLFDAPVIKKYDDDKKIIADNIARQAKDARGLFIWTDCDREGEHIGSEIREIAFTTKSNIEVKRAKFSNTERAHVIQAAKNPIMLDERQVQAVSARMELDLRIGASFTRLQTMRLKPMSAKLDALTAISYGSCQFPTLGFVVDRYFRVKNFKPETFWKIQLWHVRDDTRVAFNWRRTHLFDRMITTILFEQCLLARQARVVDVLQKPTSKWRPLPLTTVELQKCGSRFLHMDSQRVMKLAEDLYQRGFISYPRTETDMFPREMDLRALVQHHTADSAWGAYAANLLAGTFRDPRAGRNNDQAHPPIHPVSALSGTIEPDARRVYEFVTRRFLACVSDDAKGSSTTVTLQYGPEYFTASGLTVLERNYLDVYPYDKWESSTPLPKFTKDETFVPSEAKMADGKTAPPTYLTEPELIALMDANGIGTDATMAEHIAKIKEREYVLTIPRAGGAATPATRGGARGGRGGRGGSTASSRGSTGGNEMFIPTTLGVALIAGYDALAPDSSLGKPFLRREMEAQMRDICAGRASRDEVVAGNLARWRGVFVKTEREFEVLRGFVRRYVLEGDTGA